MASAVKFYNFTVDWTTQDCDYNNGVSAVFCLSLVFSPQQVCILVATQVAGFPVLEACLTTRPRVQHKKVQVLPSFQLWVVDSYPFQSIFLSFFFRTKVNKIFIWNKRPFSLTMHYHSLLTTIICLFCFLAVSGILPGDKTTKERVHLGSYTVVISECSHIPALLESL